MAFYVNSAGKPIMVGGGILREATVDDPDPAATRGAFEVAFQDNGDEINDGWYIQTTAPLPALPSGATEWIVKFTVKYPGPTSSENFVQGETTANAGDDVQIRIDDPSSARIQVLLVPVGETSGGKRRFGRPKYHRVTIPIEEEPPVSAVAPPGLTAAQITDYLTLVEDPYNEDYFTVQLTLPIGHRAYEAVTMRWAKYGPALEAINDPYPTNYPMVRLADSGTDRVWRFEERYPGDVNKKHARQAGGNFVHLAIQYQLPADGADPTNEAGLISPVVEWFSVSIPADTSEAPAINETGTFISPTSPFETDTLTVVRQASGNPDPFAPEAVWTYQWKESTVNISGATSKDLAPSEFTDGDSITCTVGVTTSSGSDSFTTPAVVIQAEPSIQPDALEADEWEIVEVVEHPSKAGFYTAHVRLLLPGPPAEYAVFWSNWVSSIQPKPGFPCDFVETDGDGRKVWRLGDYPANSNKWNTVLPSATFADLKLRYQLINHGSEPQSGYVSDNSVDSKSWTAPDEEEEEPPIPSGTFGLLPTAIINEAKNKPLRWKIGNPGLNDTFIGQTPLVMAMSSFAGHTGTDSALLNQIDIGLASSTCPPMHGGFEGQFDLYWSAMMLIVRNTPRIWSQLTTNEKNKVDLLMEAGLICGAFIGGDKNPFGTGGRSSNLTGGQAYPRGNPNFSVPNPAFVAIGAVWFGTNTAKQMLKDHNHSNLRSRLASAGLANAADSFVPRSGGPSATQVQNSLDGTWTHRGVGVDPLELWKAGINRCFGATVMSNYGGTAGNNWIGPGYRKSVNDAYRGKCMTGESTVPNRGQKGMTKEFDASDGYPPEGVRASMSYAQRCHRIGITFTCAMAAAGILNPSNSSINSLLAQTNRGNIDIDFKHNLGYLSYAKGGGGGSETWRKSEKNTSWGINFNHGLWTYVLKPWWDAG